MTERSPPSEAGGFCQPGGWVRRSMSSLKWRWSSHFGETPTFPMWLIALIGVLSLAVLALALMMWRQTRLERQRSEARIAALATAMDDPRWAMPLERDSPPNN